MRNNLAPVLCIFNYAACVKGYAPLSAWLFVTSVEFVPKYVDVMLVSVCRTVTVVCDKIHYTLYGSPGETYGPRRHQAESTARTGCSPLQTQSGQRSAISHQRLFRSAGSGVGKIRDATAGTCRREAGDRDRQAVWFFARCAVSNHGSVSSRRASGFTPAQTWPQTSAQIEWRSHGGRFRIAKDTANVLSCDYSRARSTAIRHGGSSPQHRTCPGQDRKKGAPDSFPLTADPTFATLWADRYEALRSSALGHGSERWGLALVSRQGLSAWVSSWPHERGDAPSAIASVDVSTPERPSALHGNDLIALLASMVLAAGLGGAA